MEFEQKMRNSNGSNGYEIVPASVSAVPKRQPLSFSFSWPSWLYPKYSIKISEFYIFRDETYFS